MTADASKEADDIRKPERGHIGPLEASAPALLHDAAFGLFFIWIWLGLYGGYPAFLDGAVDAPSGVLLGLGVSACLLPCALKPHLSERAGLANTSIAFAAIACLACATQAIVGFLPLGEAARIACVRTCSFAIGVGTGGLILAFGKTSSLREPAHALTGFCASSAVAFFAFFCVRSVGEVAGDVLFSMLPLAAALLARPYGSQQPAHNGDVSPAGDAFSPGFIRMVATFSVVTLAISLSQGMVPHFVFGECFDTGMICFTVLTGVVFYLMVSPSRKARTFSILKVLYQGALVLVVMKLALAILSSSNAVFPSLFVMTYMALLMDFWLLASFVGHAGEIRPERAFATLFGVAGLCLAAGWALGVFAYSAFGQSRFMVSIAAGCAVAVFSTFGFSANDFPRLTVTGVGARKRRGPSSDESSPEAQETQGAGHAGASMEDAVAAVAENHGLTRREVEILTLLAQGMTAEEIADELVISYNTVRTHIRNLYGKLEVSSRSELFVLLMGGRSDQSALPL